MNKKEKRNYISQKIDLNNTRLTNEEVDTLYNIVENYDQEYKGKSCTSTYKSTGTSSDGKYEREATNTFTFTDNGNQLGIRWDHSYHDDDGQSGSSSETRYDGRGILNFLKHFKK